MDKYGRTTFWPSPFGAGKLTGLEIDIDPARVFRSRDGPKIYWNPIRVVAVSDPWRLAILKVLAKNGQEHQGIAAAQQEAKQCTTLLEAPTLKPKDGKKTLDLPSGEYLCRRYASVNFHGAPPTPLPGSGRRGWRACD
ncbi:MAG: hypothetical protein AB2556_16110 [Candidatus Thiodiazotropha sp.]